MIKTISNLEGEEGVTILQIFGPMLSIMMILIAVTMIVLFVIGLISRFRQGNHWLFGWWLRQFSICSALLGLLAHSVFLMRFYDSIGLAAISPELWSVRQFEAYTRLTGPLCIALAGWIFGMILGPKKEK